MKHLKTFETKTKEPQKFHCYIPYNNEKLFKIALHKLNINQNIKDEILQYLKYNEFVEEYNPKMIGCFLRFCLPNWDYYEIEDKNDDKNNIDKVKKILEDPTYNTDGLISTLTKGKSKYIGEISLSKEDIEQYEAIDKYNI